LEENQKRIFPNSNKPVEINLDVNKSIINNQMDIPSTGRKNNNNAGGKPDKLSNDGKQGMEDS